ncbi:MAG: hypothetical protein EA376_01350 [Phycisphaeraceae bacterium]|nr:MAG: hypothetical protein EA376_01350 [Phycisphaeraceae bacterium]
MANLRSEADGGMDLNSDPSFGTPQSVLRLVTTGCPADLDGDGLVGSSDLAVLLGCWGPIAGACGPADLTGSGDIGSADLADLLGQWGPCP